MPPSARLPTPPTACPCDRSGSEEKGEYSISVGIRRRSSTSVKETVDYRMPNSKKGNYVVTGRPGQTSLTCFRLSQAKLLKWLLRQHRGRQTDGMKQDHDHCDIPAAAPTNPEVKAEERYDTEMPTAATTLPELDGMGEVVVPEAADDGEPHETKEIAEIHACPSTAADNDDVKLKIQEDACWRDAGRVLSEFSGEGVAHVAEEMICSSSDWRHILKHNAAVQSLHLGALRGFPANSQPPIACDGETHSDLRRSLNASVQRLFPGIDWTCIRPIRWGKGTDPMLPHTHRNDESTLSAIV